MALHLWLGVGMTGGEGVAVGERQVAAEVAAMSLDLLPFDNGEGAVDVGDVVAALGPVERVKDAVKVEVDGI